MDTAQVKVRLKQEAARVEDWLRGALDGPGLPPGLREAMDYSLLAGGKRIRPVLCLVSARVCGLDDTAILPFAAGLECIHTYSLIHDDLPAMDDDDLRRGRPSNHKQFDEATAILAGDGLLTDAFVLMARCREQAVPASLILEAIAVAAQAAGSRGMVGGQFLDMLYTGREGVGIEAIAAMHAMKTGALLCAACECGGILAGADAQCRNDLVRYGRAVGAAFQIVDDILDEIGTEEELGKPVGSDAAMSKHTYPSLLGLERSRELAIEKGQDAIQALASYNSGAADLLRGLAMYIVNRVT